MNGDSDNIPVGGRHWHGLLKRQIRKHIPADRVLGEEWQSLLNAVSHAYREFDKDNELSERSLEISNEEMLSVLEDLKTEKEKAQTLHRMARESAQAKNKFFSNMSHELRTPLHAILSYASLGLKKMEPLDAQKLQEYLEKIKANGSTLLELVDDMLDLSKMESGKMVFAFHPEDLYGLIKSSLNELEPLAQEKGIGLKACGLPNNPVLLMDATKIKQVIRNLVSNALKFAPPGTSVTVSLSEEGKEVRVSVTDGGPGIPENELGEIFEEFVQSSHQGHSGKGTGLGLSICRQIISAHGGSIWAENGKNGGAIFRFTLPLKKKENTEETRSP